MIVIGKYDPNAPLMFRWTWEFVGTSGNPFPNNYEVVMKHMRREEKFSLPELPKNTFRFVINAYYGRHGITYYNGHRALVTSGKAH